MSRHRGDTKIGIKCFSRFLLVVHGRKPSKPHFQDRRNVWKFFSTLPTFIRHNQDKKLLEISWIFLKMFGYPDLDAGLNSSRFLKVIAFTKPKRHSTLNNGDSGLETMAITIVIVLTTIPERQSIYVSNCSCYCPSTAVSLVQDSMPLRFLCELKKFSSVSSHVSSHMQWRPGIFRQGGPAAKWRPFKSNIAIKSLTRLADLAIFLIFLMVLFDTLTWSRAECIHLIDLGSGGEALRKIVRDHALQTLGKQGPCPFRQGWRDRGCLGAGAPQKNSLSPPVGT